MTVVPGDRVRLTRELDNGDAIPVGALGTVVEVSVYVSVVWDDFGGNWFMEGPGWHTPEIELVPPLKLLAEQAE